MSELAIGSWDPSMIRPQAWFLSFFSSVAYIWGLLSHRADEQIVNGEQGEVHLKYISRRLLFTPCLLHTL